MMKMLSKVIEFPVDGEFCNGCRFLSTDDEAEGYCNAWSIDVLNTDQKPVPEFEHFLEAFDYWRCGSCLELEKHQQ